MLQFIDEHNFVNMALHYDFFINVILRVPPPEVKKEDLVTAKDNHWIQCSAGEFCVHKKDDVYYNYICVGCCNFCHRTCSINPRRTYDRKNALISYQSSLPFWG